MGCHSTDNTELEFESDTAMTPDLCAQECFTAKKLPWAMVANGKFCRCGSLKSPPVSQDQKFDSCGTPCTGDTGKTCGGPAVGSSYLVEQVQGAFFSRNSIQTTMRIMGLKVAFIADVSWPVAQSEKNNWQVRGSDAAAEQIHDNLLDGDFAKAFVSDSNDVFPWIEIDMKASQIVKAVKLGGW